MKKNFLLLLLFSFLFQVSSTNAFAENLFKKSVLSAVAKADKDSVKDPIATYKKIVKDATTKKGILISHFTKENKFYLEIPDSAMNDLYLFSNRVVSTSNTSDYVAGQMATNPFIIRFTKDAVNVYMHIVQNDHAVRENDPIASSFKNNFTDPILRGFPIVGKNGTNVMIDMSAFFGENEKSISPIKPDNPLAKLFGTDNSLKGSFVADASTISSVKNFPNNMEIRSTLTFITMPLNRPYTVIMQRSIVALPKEPMKMRLQDNRVGFFYSDKNFYTSEKDKMENFQFIHRWRLEPKEAEMEQYLKGELVEPVKPIVFYVDSAFPDKWRNTVKQGIRDWSTAFEAAGFKNAILAKDYPRNDPNFDPEDMRFSCIKYATTPVANAMGPSHVDPRSGEILNADVIWYHNILSLLHNWRFTQTAAVDKRVRKAVFDDDVMQESMRYVTSHEIGHTLGLMHDMGASYSYPVDSLRSPSFTQKYGTTPSIMDYARNNFIAQPGDLEKGVKLTPPILGVYDIHAINWGYRIIPNTSTPKEEKKVLTQWIQDKRSNTMFEFGAQQFLGTIDPTDQTEDLGNDHIKAGDLAIKNLKVIMSNFVSWTTQDGENISELSETYEQIVKQYTRHLVHVMPYIGGVRFNEIKQGELGSSKNYLCRADQKRAMEWLVNQAKTYNDWITPPQLIAYLNLEPSMNDKLQLGVVGSLLNSSSLARINEGGRIDPKLNYSLNEYVNDALKELFKGTYAGTKLSNAEITLQTVTLAVLIKYSGLEIKSTAGSKSKSSIAFDSFNELNSIANEPSLPCSLGCSHSDGKEDNSFFRLNFGTATLSSIISAPLMTASIKRILVLYKQKQATTTDVTTKDFYNYQIIEIERLFKL